MLKLIVFSMLILSCGTKSSDTSCTEAAEISQLALSTQSFGTAGALIDATVTVKNQCPNVQYYAVYALKKDTAPTDCTDGDSKISGSTASWSGLALSSTYFVRACATRDSYVSTGIVKSITTNP